MVKFRLIYQLSRPFFIHKIRPFCTTYQSEPNKPPPPPINRSVYISKSHDIYTNLALEDWIYKNVNCGHHHILMLWSNNPCVVIGRHQNPWLEANIAELKNITEEGVKFARRNSGGGTVFHDRGNLNLTFFTSREQYNRKTNLQFIQKVLRDAFSTEIEINKREDLVIRDCKVSGTAAKLGRLSSYHHCTLLVNADKANLSLALKKQESEIKTNATQSVKSKIMNLREENSSISVEGLLDALGRSFLLDGKQLVEGETSHEKANDNELREKFRIIEPNDQEFPGLEEIREGLESWEWRFGKTPKFTISRNFSIPKDLLPSDLGPSDLVPSDLAPSDFVSSNSPSDLINAPSESSQGNDLSKQQLRISLLVENGLIQDVTLSLPVDLVGEGFDASVLTHLKGQKFTEDSLHDIRQALEADVKLQNDVKSKFVVDCFRKVVMNRS